MEEDDILYQSIIADPEKVSPNVDISRLRTETQTDPRLLGAVSEFPGLQFDPTQYSAYEDLYDLYSTGLPMIPTPATDTAQIPGAADTLVNVGSQDQATGDLGLDTTFQDAGATDVPGTIGTLGSLTEPTTQIAPTVNPLDEFGTAGDVYADVPPTTVNVPALNLSGTSEELIDQGVIETPQEFYGRTYNTSPSEYNLLDQEEKNLVDQQYGTAYNLAPEPEPVPDTNLLEVAGNILGNQFTNIPGLGTVASAILGGDQTAPSPAPVGTQFGEEGFADPVVDAEENQPDNIQTIDTPKINVPQENITTQYPEIDYLPDPDEITEGLTFQTPAEQIYSSTEPVYYDFDEPAPAPAPAPAPVYYDSGNGDSGGGGGSSSSSTAGDAPGYSGPSPFKEGGFVKKHAKR
jgi:hypothetical protein